VRDDGGIAVELDRERVRGDWHTDAGGHAGREILALGGRGKQHSPISTRLCAFSYQRCQRFRVVFAQRRVLGDERDIGAMIGE
jgi:hypothetical protein